MGLVVALEHTVGSKPATTQTWCRSRWRARPVIAALTVGVPTCVDACAGALPPLMVDSADVPAGLDLAVFPVVERPDGGLQLKAGAWRPLYFFAGDATPGDVNGQGSGDVWFVAAPDGSFVGADQ